MFDKGFYPTPEATIDIMLSGLDFKNIRSFLDPSAGKGDILDAIVQKRNAAYQHHSRYDNQDELYAIELEPGRQAILRDKGYKVVDSDFLTYNGLQYFDFFVINPPFDDGASHLLKAFDVANGAIIRCLLNAETLNNPYTEERKRLNSIIKRYGWSKDLGQAFRDSERPTNVFVTLVHLHDTRKGEAFHLDFEPKKMNGRYKFEDVEKKGLASINVFESYEAQHNAAVAAFKELLYARQKVDHFLNPLLTEYKSGRSIVAEALKGSQGPVVAYEKFLKEATKEAWASLFAKTKLRNVTTEGVRKELEKAQTQQGLMAFTASNMEQLFNQLFASREGIMEDCIVDAFETMTKWHDGNRVHVEGYKTNSSYKVGKRFILNNMGATWGEGLDYSSKQQVADIEKALCFLTGKRLDSIASLTTVYDNNSRYGEKTQSEFFECKLYKKGSLHFLWKDFDLMDRFNMVAGQKLWGNRVPEKTKSGAFS